MTPQQVVDSYDRAMDDNIRQRSTLIGEALRVTDPIEIDRLTSEIAILENMYKAFRAAPMREIALLSLRAQQGRKLSGLSPASVRVLERLAVFLGHKSADAFLAVPGRTTPEMLAFLDTAIEFAGRL